MNDNILKIINIIANIVMLLIFIMTIINKQVYANYYWAFIAIYFLIDLINTMQWDYDGININKKEANVITMKYKNITAITLVISGLIYLLVIGFEILNTSITQNLYVITFLYLLLATSQLLNHLAINHSKKEMQKLIKNTYSN